MKQRRFTGNRISAAAIGVPAASILVWLFGVSTGVIMPTEIAAAFGAVCTYLARVLIPDEIEEP